MRFAQARNSPAYTPFRVTGSNLPGHNAESADLHYRASAILRKLDPSFLTRIHIADVEISGSDLKLLVSKLPQFGLKAITLCSVHLDEGSFAKTIEALRESFNAKLIQRTALFLSPRLVVASLELQKSFDQPTSMFRDDDEQDAFCMRSGEHT